MGKNPQEQAANLRRAIAFATLREYEPRITLSHTYFSSSYLVGDITVCFGLRPDQADDFLGKYSSEISIEALLGRPYLDWEKRRGQQGGIMTSFDRSRDLAGILGFRLPTPDEGKTFVEINQIKQALNGSKILSFYVTDQNKAYIIESTGTLHTHEYPNYPRIVDGDWTPDLVVVCKD